MVTGPEKALGQYKAGEMMGSAMAVSPFLLLGMWTGFWTGTIEKTLGIYRWQEPENYPRT